MSKISNPAQNEASLTAKGSLQYKEFGRLLFFGIPWPFKRYEVYDNEMTIISGFLNIKEDDCFMYKITDVELSSSLLQRIVGLSTITLFTSDVTDKTIIMKNIKHGREIKDFINQESERARLRRRTVNMQNIGFNDDVGADIDDLQ
ncbi:PH domain-containing protein [Butyrivibrio sp. VCD2006]|uniref:PH domain-containing protein n=1 Tax=Butyrivibrio sp. VCD2006 TaxID=1280664 RepID=UPI000420B6BB|nr:PH domain-containing protein [Butyrivibrio sp. VCD2006]